jgi:RNA polymerase-binding transcription factor DksA
MNVRYCKGCGEQIHPKRLEIIPNAVTCVPCSTVQKKGAVTLLKEKETILGLKPYF